MYIFELTQPGSRLAGSDDDAQLRDQEALLGLLITCIEDASLSLTWFEAADVPAESFDRQVLLTQRNERLQQERRIAASMEAQLPQGLSPAEHFRAMRRITELSSIQAKKERWWSGEVPQSYQHRAQFIHAKSCLYALDTIQKSLALLAKFPDAPADVSSGHAELVRFFPDLQHVRDSSHHTEDRVQGKRRAARIDRASSGGMLVVDLLDGNKYSGTLADGRIGQVEISDFTVAIAHRIVQNTLNSYEWTGYPLHFPF